MTTLNLYKTYSFRNKDPVIDELRGLVDTEYGKHGMAAYNDLHEKSGVSASTLYNWFMGPTRRPQSASVEAVGRSLGYRREWVRLKNGK